MKRIALSGVLTCLFAFASSSRADCASGSCATAATFTGPVATAVRTAVHAQPVRTLFAHQPVRAMVRAVFGRRHCK